MVNIMYIRKYDNLNYNLKQIFIFGKCHGVVLVYFEHIYDPMGTTIHILVYFY
jgi:hypothetical protein